MNNDMATALPLLRHTAPRKLLIHINFCVYCQFRHTQSDIVRCTNARARTKWSKRTDEFVRIYLQILFFLSFFLSSRSVSIIIHHFFIDTECAACAAVRSTRARALTLVSFSRLRTTSRVRSCVRGTRALSPLPRCRKTEIEYKKWNSKSQLYVSHITLSCASAHVGKSP